ncbi:hypothetical protein [Marinobacter sp.]|uniref:hypothetical protein n=1 Tax=Marinobacter sp. TaxID=50741 RepID=UPI00384AB62B
MAVRLVIARSLLPVLAGFMPLQAQSQTFGGLEGIGGGINDRVTGYTASASVFTEVEHNRVDIDDGTETSTDPSLGVSGALGADLQSGASSLSALYSGSVQTRRDSVRGVNRDNSSVTGVSRYSWFAPANRFDFNAGHTVRSVRSDAGFVLDPAAYDVQNAVHAGAGLRFYPGELTTVRFFTQGARTFEQGDRPDLDSLTAGSDLTRRLSERSSASLTATRTWAEEVNSDITQDSVQLGYRRALEQGLFTVGAGVSSAEVDFDGQSETTSEAVTGYLSRSWLTPDTSTEIRYDRALTSTALELAVDFPEVETFEPVTLLITELSVEDRLQLRHNTSALCSGCALGGLVGGSIFESERTGRIRHEYRAAVNLGVQVAPLQRLSTGYSWSADAGKDADELLDQVHRLSAQWTRSLAENTSVSVLVSHSFTDTSLDQPDRDRTLLRLSLTHGITVTGR